MFFITLRFYTSGLGLRWPSSWARLAQVSATRQRYRCHRFGTLLRWGFRFLSRIRLSCFDYSRVTRVRVLLTFYPTSLRSLRILASLRVTHCDSLLLAYPHVFLTCGTFLEFVGFFLLVRATVALASIATKIIAPILLLALRSTALFGGFLPNFAIFALVSVHLGKFNFSSLPSFGISNAFLCQLSLPIHLYLSPLVLQFLSSVSQPILAAPS